jgi:hypothetical protein
VHSLLVAATMVVLVVTPAYADPDDLVARPLVLDDHTVEVRLTAAINVQPRLIGKPLSLSPDAWWGISPRWTVGVIHSSASVDQIDAGATLCVRQSDISTCKRLYHGSGLDVRFSAVGGPLAVAPRLRVLLRDIDPVKPAIALGALVRWTRGRFAITSDPYLRLPLANRDLGNRAALFVPIWFVVQPARGWALALHTGYDAEIALLRDSAHGPVGLAALTRLTREIDLGLEAGWAQLLGPQHDGRHGTVMITGGWRR